MDRTALKKYAPQARRDFIAAITDRAGFYGLTKKHVEPVKIEGSTAIIGGRPFDRSVAIKRMGLERRIEREGFDAVMEAIAYTWFNRFVAIRYMELHGYLDHGYRVLSHPEAKATPEIVEHAQHVSLPGLHPQRIIDLKLAGDKDADLYRMLLVAQCNALNKSMPFLFEPIDHDTELLLPDNLLHTDSLVRRLVRDIPEENWQEIEVIGWIYQFYISEKKDEVIGKVVKSEDIPAATQLFTPNWIVKYLVQNSIGRQWLATYPDSPLRQQMEYYIEPAEQTPEVQAQLKAITPESLNPEDMTLLDPACGSGHILVEAYDLFKAIYQERGYRAKDIPRLILRNNLFGLEIDDRAAQLAAFALIMKARADDKRVLEGGIRMNVRCIQSSDGLTAEEVYEALSSLSSSSSSRSPDPYPLPPAQSHAPCSLSDIRQLLALFKGEDAKTFGSLIRIPDALAAKLLEIVERTDLLMHGDDLGRKMVAERFAPIAEQAWVLGRRYDAVVANPPYMGPTFATLKVFAEKNYPDAKTDLYAMFLLRGIEMGGPGGLTSMVTMQSWMFLASYEDLRAHILRSTTLLALAQFGARAFDSISGDVVQTAATIIFNSPVNAYCSRFFRLVRGRSESEKLNDLRDAIADIAHECNKVTTARRFAAIPGQPIAYWVSDQLVATFQNAPTFGKVGKTRRGLQTGDASRFVRKWFEVNWESIGRGLNKEAAKKSGKKWFFFNSGGAFRKWYGNIEDVVNWFDDGREIKATGKAIIPSEPLYFQEAITWPKVGSGVCSFRWFPEGIIPGDAGPCFYGQQVADTILCFANTKVSLEFLSFFSPNLNFEVGVMAKMPLPQVDLSFTTDMAKTAIQIHKEDWDSSETSPDFGAPHHRSVELTPRTLRQAFLNTQSYWQEVTMTVKALEERNNELFIAACGLASELRADVPLSQVTLLRNPNFRSAGAAEQFDLDARTLPRLTVELLSYAIGCMMGRYSLDEPGLIYAHSGNEGFDPSRYATFPADPDGIIPLTEHAWFDDDATNRFVEFIAVAWPKEHLEENLAFVAESLGAKSNESPRATIRRYLATGFYKDHLQTYKRRPIYWLFTSGKERAFQCLVYLHRYNEGTLARMRTEYVIPLQGKMNARIEHLKHDIAAATSTAHGKKLQKEHDTLRKHLEELRTFDEKLNHYAAQRIPLDLDDGVKVNYAKFGDLLAEVKAVTGDKSES